MAKSFGGFTPVQQKSLLSKMGYDGPAQQDDINKFMMSSPRAAAMMGKYATLARGIMEPSTRGFAVGGVVDENLMNAVTVEPTATGLQHPSTLPENQVSTFDPSAYKKVSTVGGGSAYVDPNTKMVYNYSGTPYTGQVDIAGGGMYYDVADGVATEAGSKKQVPGGPGAARTYSTPSGQQVYFNADDEKYYTASGQPYTGKVNMISGEQYDVTEGVNPAYTGVNAYDPTTGMPMPVGGAGDVDAYLEGTVPDFMKGGIKSIIESGNIPADPNKYEITGGPGNWTITYDNGQSFTSPNLNPASAENDAKMAAAALSGYTGGTGTDLYQSQLEEFKQYQKQQAEAAAAVPVYETIQDAQNQVAVHQNIISNYMQQLAGMEQSDPRRTALEQLIADEQIKLNNANAGMQQAQQRAAQERSAARLQASAEFEADPGSKVKVADVQMFSPEQKEAGMIAEGTGQAAATVDQAGLTQAQAAADVATPVAKEAVTYDATTAAAGVQDTVNKLVAATGKPSDEALAEGATMTPQDLASLGLTVDQISQATQVVAPEARTMQAGEEVTAAVDFERAKEETRFEAATGVPSTEATVQGQLTQLLSQFEGGATPAWAAGAMRAATATLAARGLAASSMAGQAIVQAAMESALPIAQQDAQIRAQFEAQNLSNRQQAAMFAAEQRAKFLGMEFDQEFQSRVANAAKVSDIANMNFTAEQQIALENARLTQTVDIANLNARNAKIMADAAAMTQVDVTNLNNRQQAAIQYANSFLQMDMANLTNEQQAAMFRSQSIVNSLLSDQAAENAAKQFNATSENQTNQFYDSLTAQVQQFNVDQTNAMERFNAGEANALAEFNAAQQARREEFNAQNALIVEQANAKWSQDIAVAETAAINEANRQAAQAENDMTTAAYEAQVQMERDKMSYAFQTANNNADRATSIAVETMRNEAAADQASAQKSASFASAAGSVISAIIMG